MRKMGGLRKKMPVTCWTFFIGVLAISGAGIAGTQIGLGGFFSKDEILAVAWTRAYDWTDQSRHEHHAANAGDDNEPHVMLASDPVHGDAARAPDTSGLHSARGSGHGGDPTGVDKSAIRQKIPPLPKWMFWTAIITAYITPFYMMRCWWMTFMGKPRDKHVYEHAHETPLMYVPLIVLAVGTFVASYYIFRPLIADAATAATGAATVLATDGEVHSDAIKAAHSWLVYGVGGAFIVGFALAIAIYWRGLATATAIKKVLAPIHLVLEKKYFIDELYDFVWVKGCVLVAHIARFVDTYLVDMVYNLIAKITERFAAFCGLIIDNHGVDGVVNGIAASSRDIGDMMRRPQSGRIRNYVLFATGAATVVIICFLIWWSEPHQEVLASVISARP